MGVGPTKSFGEKARKVIEKQDVHISASSQKELATFAAGYVLVTEVPIVFYIDIFIIIIIIILVIFIYIIVIFII